MTVVDLHEAQMDEMFAGLWIVDCDTHFTEPPDLWTSRAPASLRDRMPVLRTVDGQTAWFLDGELWASLGGNTIEQGMGKVLGEHILQPFETIDPAAWRVEDRLALMDRMGIWSQVVYPNGIGFASNHVFAIEDDEIRTAILQTYNDFYVDIQAESGERLLPQAILPVWDMTLTVREIERLVDKGIRGFTLSDKPEMLGLPELLHPYFEPMWDLVNDTRSVISFHIGSGMRRAEVEKMRAARREADDPERGGAHAEPPAVPDPFWRYFSKQRRQAVHATQQPMSNMRIIANLCASNLFDRFPNVKIVSAESGIGWIPFLLEALEFQLDEMVTELDPSEIQQRRPSEYFRDHLYAMFWFERYAPAHMIEQIGVGNVLACTDVPHPTCLYPRTQEHFADVLSNVSPEIRQRVLQDNAVELYRLTIPNRPA